MTLPPSYNLLSYDLLYVIIKAESGLLQLYGDLIAYDQKRKKYYIPGRLIMKQRIDKKSEHIIRYPRYRTLALIHRDHLKAQQQSRNEAAREALILSIPYAAIESIVLPFDTLDWMK